MIPGIEVKIGADTTGLDAGVAKAGAALGRMSQDAAKAGSAASSSLGQGLAKASANASRSFGLIEGAAARMALKSSTAMAGLGNAFTGAGQGAVKASDATAQALDRMADAAVQSSARSSAALDAALAKYQQFGTASGGIPGNLPGLGGPSLPTGGGLPDPFVAPTKGAEKLSANIGNLAAQFNDIGVTAAMGMSPMMIALQQGTQLSQAFAGQKLGDVARGLGGAFMSMVSPVSLVTIGLTGLVALGAQWALGALAAGNNSKTFAENLDAAATAVDELRGYLDKANSPLADLKKRFGTSAAKAQELYVALARIQTLRAMTALSEAAASAKNELSGLEGRLARIDEIIRTGQEGSAANVIARQVRLIGEEFGLTEAQARLVLQRMNELGAAQGPTEIARAAGSLADALSVARDEAGNIPPEIAALVQELLEASLKGLSLEDAIIDAKKAADDLAASGPGSGWLSNAIGAAETLGSKLWDAWRAKTALENPGGFEPVGEGELPEGATRPPPRAPSELGIPDIPARGGRGGGAKGPSLADRLESLREDLATEQETIATWYAENLQTLDDALAARALKEQEYRDMREKLEKEHEERLRGIRGAGQQSALATVLSTGQDILNAIGQTNQKALRAAQAFGAGIALINAYQAASEALKDPRLPWFARIAAAGKVLAAGIGFVNAIKGVNASASGVTSGAGRGAGAGQSVQGPGQTISISYDGPDFARQPIEAVVGQLNDFIKRGGRIDGVMMA